MADPQANQSHDEATTPSTESLPLPPTSPSASAADEDDAQKQIATLTELLQMERASFINYRARTRDEFQDWLRRGKTEAVLALVPLIENLSRAVSSMPSNASHEQWKEAIAQIVRLGERQLASLQVERISTMGAPFDSSLHEAVSQAPGEEGMVVHEVDPGYLMEGKPIAVAKVVIGNTPSSTKSEPSETNGIESKN